MTDGQWRAVFEIYESIQSQPEEDAEAFLSDAAFDPDVVSQLRALLGTAGEDEFALAEAASIRPDLKPGDVVHHFEIREQIGAGATGTVFSAWDTQLARHVALKFLAIPKLLQKSCDSASPDGFLREARAASAIQHPSIVTVHSIVRVQPGEDESSIAIVMELVEGVPLRSLCDEPMPRAKALDIARQVASALAAVYSRGIVHGDIKPENIMVRPDGIVKVVDFGLAQELSKDIPEGARLRPGGTFRYMSPEQYSGALPSGASDVFSLGIVLYEMLTGRTPFSDLPAAEAAATQSESPINLTGIPGWIRTLLAKMLSLEPTRRPGAAEVLTQAAKLIDAPSRFWTRAALVLAVAVVAIVASFIGWSSSKGKDGPPPEPAFEQITRKTAESRVTSAAVSPDGADTAYATVDGGIFIRDNRTGRVRELPAPKQLKIYRMAFPADPKAPLLVAGASGPRTETQTWAVHRDGSSPDKLWSGASEMAISPDISQVAVIAHGHREISLMPIAGGPSKKVFEAGQTEVIPMLFWASTKDAIFFRLKRLCAPGDAEVNASLLGSSECGEGTIQRLDLSTGERRIMARDRIMISAASLRDGSILYLQPANADNYAVFDIWKTRIDPETEQFEKPRQMTHLGVEMSQLSASVDGNVVAVMRSNARPNISVADLGGRDGLKVLRPRPLTNEITFNFPHAWTADSESVIFESIRSGNEDLFVQAPGHREAETIVAEKGDEVMAQVSPDGKLVLYSWYPTAPLRNYLDQHKLMQAPISRDSAAREVPIGGDLDEFRCGIPGYGTRCVLRVSKADEQIYYDLDPVRGKGAELGRSKTVSKVMGAWALSADGTRVGIPDSGRLGEFVELALSEDPGARSERRVMLKGVGPVHGMNPFPGKPGWLLTLREEAERTVTPGIVEVPTRKEGVFYVDEHRNVTLLVESALNAYGVVSPNGKRLAYLDTDVSSDVWSFHLAQTSVRQPSSR